MTETSSNTPRISLPGSVALGTGVMIGAGIFALVGQVAGLAGAWFPLALLAGGVVAALSAYSYARYSAVNPSSGGIAMLLKDAYGPGVVAGSFSMFMYVSMVVAESLLARTFGTYLLTPFDLQDSTFLVAVCGVAAILAAAGVNLIGNRVVEASALTTALLKIVGLGVLAIGGLLAAWLGSGASTAGGNEGASVDPLAAVGSVALCVLAYKGFTTITNQGDDLREPKKNLPRSIYLSLAVCAVLYLLIALSVEASIGAEGAARARDYALAEAANPLFDRWGVWLTVAVAVIATLSGLLASLYSVSRLYGMLQEMHQAPRLPCAITHQPLLITAAAALLLTLIFDLSQIASLGVFLYLTMDIVVQWGMLRRLREKTRTRSWPPLATIAVNLVVLIPFTIVKVRDDPIAVAAAAAIAGVVVIAQTVAVRRRRRATAADGERPR
ncbi:APC family permease [Streptomyces sp. NPDC079189]|uniref:APC family permease n=1 Tax=Actinomycetes TaxID=1760 RepID=UPI00342B78D8